MFPGRGAGGFLNQDAMADVLSKMRPGRHGARLPLDIPGLGAERTTPEPRGRNGAGARHPSGSRGAYRRGDLFEKRTQLMGEWAAFCAAPARGEGVVLRR